MTSQQILQSDLLDILFEGRNKAYGAYQLRRDYNLHLVAAISIALVSAFALFLIMNPTHAKTMVPDSKERIVVVQQVDLPKDLPKPKPATMQEPKTKARQERFTTQIEITRKDLVDPMPPLDLLETSAISTVTTKGDDATLFQAPKAVEAGSAGGSETSEAAEKPREVKPDKQPQFPGGIQAWIAFLNRNLRSPSDLEAGEKRTVMIRFHVAEDGTVTNFSVMQSAGAVFDNEVIRVLKKMPKWSPALQAGQPVSVSFTQPVTFVGIDE